MKITICGSMAFAKDMYDTKKELEVFGHEAFIPENVEKYLKGDMEKVTDSEGAERKIKQDLIRAHYNLIAKSDAVLVLNKDKSNVKNYIGGNSFLEMGSAHVLNKKIFLLNPIPEMPHKEELIAMQPTIINGDLNKIL